METFTQEQQVLVDKLVGDARTSARAKAEADAAAATQANQDKEHTANLAAKQEWEQLAQTHEARVKELEPLTATVERYQTFVDGVLEETIKSLGDAAKSAVKSLPEGMTSMDKLSWLNDNRGLFEATEGAVGTPTRPRDKGKIDPVAQNRFPVKL